MLRHACFNALRRPPMAAPRSRLLARLPAARRFASSRQQQKGGPYTTPQPGSIAARFPNMEFYGAFITTALLATFMFKEDDETWQSFSLRTIVSSPGAQNTSSGTVRVDGVNTSSAPC
jgi:hypothetical protein